MTVSYDDIYRNIAKTDIDGAVINVTWKCPISEEIVAESNARMTPKKDLKTNLKAELTRGAIQQAKWWFASLVTSMLGGAAGNTVRRLGTTVANHVQKTTHYDADCQKEAILRAWDKVKDKFEYSEDCMVYVARKSASAATATPVQAKDSPPPLPGGAPSPTGSSGTAPGATPPPLPGKKD